MAGGELGEEAKARDLVLVLGHLVGAVRGDHVIQALVGGPRYLGVLAHDVEVLVEGALPVRLAVVADIQTLAQAGEDVLAGRHRCFLRGSAGAPAGLLSVCAWMVGSFRKSSPGRGRPPEGKTALVWLRWIGRSAHIPCRDANWKGAIGQRSTGMPRSQRGWQSHGRYSSHLSSPTSLFYPSDGVDVKPEYRASGVPPNRRASVVRRQAGETIAQCRRLATTSSIRSVAGVLSRAVWPLRTGLDGPSGSG